MIQKMKGTYDLTDTIPVMHDIEHAMTMVSRLFQYKEIRTPHFEASDLFHRSVGETSDIVSKETYDFLDRGNRGVTLRPEGTAGVVRAYIENKLYADKVLPQKYYYYGSMFRYERPQKGRFREFRQFGAEALGSDRPEMDAEIIAYAVTFLHALKLSDVTVHLNSLGDQESKKVYHQALKAHMKDYVNDLCNDCKKRYEDNPLRMLDCKVDAEHEALLSAPKPIDYLNEDDLAHFESVKRYLEAMQIPYVVDPSLVRGLDYYTHTVFELKVSKDLLGNQNTICGGGRYNHLVETLGGPSTPAVGFAFGIERLVVALEAGNLIPKEAGIHGYMIVLGDDARQPALELLQRLRIGGLMFNTDFLNRSLKAQFKQSDHQNARFALIIGEQEALSRTVQIKDQVSGDSVTATFENAYDIILNAIRQGHTCDCDDCDDTHECKHKGE